MKSKILTALLFLVAAASVACVLLELPLGYLESKEPDLLAAIASPLLFLVACVLVFINPRFSHGIGLAAGLIALPWLLGTELLNFKIANSWIAFNFYDNPGGFAGSIVFSKFKILAVALILIVIVLSSLRLLPARWKLRNLPICQRTWPAFAVCLLVLATWFGCAATPYRVPLIVDKVWPDLSILHVEKHGLQFHETTISIQHDRTFYISHNDRRLFHYRFAESYFKGYLPETMYQRVLGVSQWPEFSSLPRAQPKPLRTWNAEGWYLLAGRSRMLVFSSEYGTEPPKEVMDVFREIRSSASTENWQQGGLRDVCLGFCYDPTAGVGMIFVNERCRSDENGDHCE